MTDDRATLYASVSRESYTAWRDLAAEHGVTLAALVDALGPRLRETPGPDLPQLFVGAIEEARAISAQRRSRRRPEGV